MAPTPRDRSRPGFISWTKPQPRVPPPSPLNTLVLLPEPPTPNRRLEPRDRPDPPPTHGRRMSLSQGGLGTLGGGHHGELLSHPPRQVDPEEGTEDTGRGWRPPGCCQGHPAWDHVVFRPHPGPGGPPSPPAGPRCPPPVQGGGSQAAPRAGGAGAGAAFMELIRGSSYVENAAANYTRPRGGQWGQGGPRGRGQHRVGSGGAGGVQAPDGRSRRLDLGPFPAL